VPHLCDFFLSQGWETDVFILGRINKMGIFIVFCRVLSPLNAEYPMRRVPSAEPQALADHFLTLSHNDPGSLSSNHRPGTSPPSSRNLLAEAESTHNSFHWTILQGTSLFSRFYSATTPVNSRKQGFYQQNMGGGGGTTDSSSKGNRNEFS
jgi:hypothetical protein